MTGVVYLDHAATSWPKAPGVADVIARWFDGSGVSADRGDSSRNREVAGAVQRTRAALAARCGVRAERVAFTSGATEALNLLLRGFLAAGDRVVTTATEHSSVVRPLVALRDELRIRVDVVRCDDRGRVDPTEVAAAVAAQATRLLVVSHASNVTGAVQDVGPMIDAARAAGAVTLLDASQTAGVVPIDVGADAVVASAHKALLGPPGLGFAALRDGVEPRTLKHGGTGSSRALERHPDSWPQAFEAGTPNTPAILGLGAALDWIATQDLAAVLERACGITDAIAAALARDPEVRPLPRPAAPRLPILGFRHATMDPAELGVLLDEAGVVCRTGFHCAPWIHRFLGTEASGTVRLSAGPFVSGDAPDRVAAALAP